MRCMYRCHRQLAGVMESETRQCRKCGEVKPLSSFPRRYGRRGHLRENTCGMCKKRAHLGLHPEQRRIYDYRRRARAMGLTFTEYVARQWHKKRRKGFVRTKAKKNTRKVCPL